MASKMVQLVIKAPNQFTRDYIVECQRQWSVGQLKELLSQEYPSRPKPDSQKLIYSGKLLTDNMILKDVIRTYGGFEYNTIHLVCSIKEPYRTPPTPSSNPIWTSEPSTSFSIPPSTANVSDHTDMPRAVQNTEYHGSLMTDEDIELCMRAVYIAYADYMTNAINQQAAREETEREQENERSIQPNRQQVPQQNNNNNVEVEEEFIGPRDWLEWIYVITRLIVLFCIVYFYSSPIRFFIVLAMALFLLNMDGERLRHRIDADPTRQNNADDDSDRVVHDAHELPRLFNIVSTFVTSFFLSLIPDHRPI